MRLGDQGGHRPHDKVRIGLIATDALRILGLQTILGDGGRFCIVPLWPPKSVASAGLELAIVDSSATMDVLDLIATLRRLKPQLRLLVLGTDTGFEHIERVIGAGAKGYLSQTASESELLMAIDVVRDGSVWAPRKVLARLLELNLRQPAGSNGPGAQFTKRELEVMRLLVMGHPNRQIAALLGVDEGTVKAHMGRLMRKAGVDNRTALSMRALEQRWT